MFSFKTHKHILNVLTRHGDKEYIKTSRDFLDGKLHILLDYQNSFLIDLPGFVLALLKSTLNTMATERMITTKCSSDNVNPLLGLSTNLCSSFE